jgi:hypothetical protein
LSATRAAFAVARPVVYSKPRPTAAYDTILRRPRKGDVFFWTVSLYEIENGKRLGSLALLPHGVTVTKLSVRDADVAMSLALDEKVARVLGAGRALDVVATRDALRAMPRAWDVLTGKADHIAAFGKLLAAGGIETAGVRKLTRAAHAKEARKARESAKPSKQAYRALVLASLAKLRPALVSYLRRHVFVHPIPEGAKELAFELHWQTLDAVPIVGYWMDGDNGQVQTGPQGKRTLVANVAILPNKRVLSKGDLAPFTAAEVETLGVHAPLVLAWFVAAWKEAASRGKTFPLPATIQYHDGGRVKRLS